MILAEKIKLGFGGKKILLVGLGLQGGGEGVARFLLQAGAKLTITDLKPKNQFAGILKKFAGKKIKFILGRHRFSDFKLADIIVKNPAVPGKSPFIKYAKRLGKDVLSETQIFFNLVPREKIIGITGTKGKTTTAMILAHLLRARFKIVLVGNIPGHSALESLLSLKKMPDFFVYELSSFNLEGLRVSPRYAIITNIFPDHLNRYKNFAEYKKTKENIFRYQAKGDFLWFGKKNDTPPDIAEKVALFFGISARDIKKRLKSFKPAEGRMEYLGKIKGVHVVNDTTATNPGAAIFSLAQVEKRFKVKPSRVILIAGGEDKKLKYDAFSKKMKRLKKVILLPGRASDKIKFSEALRVSSLKEGVKKAFDFVKKGNVILFSPGAASFNMFKNEFERGKAFKKAVFGVKSGVL
ncbi:MAG: Mur ligase family protein [Patescibacteria group bacterium]